MSKSKKIFTFHVVKCRKTLPCESTVKEVLYELAFSRLRDNRVRLSKSLEQATFEWSPIGFHPQTQKLDQHTK